MSAISRTVVAVLISLSSSLSPPGWAEPIPLDLANVEALALARDLSAQSLRAQAAAMREQAVAAGQLPDPKLKLGAMNLPTDTFDRAQEPMTQMQLGVQQAFPPGNSRQVKQQRGEAMARAGDAKADAQARAIRREARLRYLELYYQGQAHRIVDASRALFEQLVEITESHYAAGRKNQQDVLRAHVELALLDDRMKRIQTAQDKARAALVKLIGGEARGPLAEPLPALAPLPSLSELQQAIAAHPIMRMENSRVEAGRFGVGLARERYKPGWMVDLTYGDRSGENPAGDARSDFFSAMVMLDLPLFTDKRQDRVLAAQQQDLAARQLDRDDRRLELQRVLENDHAEWIRLGERQALYQTQVVPQAQQNAAASVNAYQSGVTDFSGLMRARLTELDSQLVALRVEVDRTKAQARLLYLAGEQ